MVRHITFASGVSVRYSIQEWQRKWGSPYQRWAAGVDDWIRHSTKYSLRIEDDFMVIVLPLEHRPPSDEFARQLEQEYVSYGGWTEVRIEPERILLSCGPMGDSVRYRK